MFLGKHFCTLGKAKHDISYCAVLINFVAIIWQILLPKRRGLFIILFEYHGSYPDYIVESNSIMMFTEENKTYIVWLLMLDNKNINESEWIYSESKYNNVVIL